MRQVLPLWKRHHAACAAASTAGLQMVAEEIKARRQVSDAFLLPTPYNEGITDSNLVSLWPRFRPASRDYLNV